MDGEIKNLYFYPKNLLSCSIIFGAPTYKEIIISVTPISSSISASTDRLSFYLNKPKLHKVTKLETISVDMPKELLHILKVRKLDFPKAVRESLAVELYREGLISLGKAAEIAMVSKWEMFEILAAKKVPLQYYPEDLKKDIETLKSALA